MTFLLWRKPTLANTGLLKGFADQHCHLLPAVDDGAQTLEDSLSILQEYEREGIAQVWLTPHIMEDMPNTTAALRQAYEALKAAYNGPIALHLAAENMLDGLFHERLATRDLLTLPGNRLLVETSYFNPPMNLRDTLRQIMTAGMRPLLAHPERYVYMSTHDYEELKAMGVEFQLNIPSLAGAYGTPPRDKARALLKRGMYNAAATDTHTLNAFRAMAAARLAPQITEALRTIM